MGMTIQVEGQLITKLLVIKSRPIGSTMRSLLILGDTQCEVNHTMDYIFNPALIYWESEVEFPPNSKCNATQIYGSGYKCVQNHSIHVSLIW